MAQLKDLLVNGSARVIGSLFANLSGNVLNFGVCSTAAATAAKTVTTNGTFELITGSKILVLFSETDTSNAPTLNVNGTGAKNIKINASDGIGKGFLAAQQYYWFIYDGTNWRTTGAGITQIIPTQYGGTGNSSYTANRIIYSNTATKLASGTVTTDGAYLGNISYLSVNNNHQTNYRLYVNGTSYFNGLTTVYGPLRVGRDDAAAGYATANVGANNYIAFYGVFQDGAGGYNHTYIGESIYGPKGTANEQSELLLFHGNNPGSDSGPDRIRLFAGEVDIQVYTSALSGTWDTIRATTGTQIANFKNGMSTFSTSVTVGTSTSGALGIAQTDGAGRGISLYNGPTSAMPDYGIAFAKTATFGTFGDVSNDWATYFTMNRADNRGWIFKSNGAAANSSNNVASISGRGHFTGSLTPSTWIDGQKNMTAAYNIADYANTDSYNPWMRATNTWSSGASNAKVGRWFSFGTLGSCFYLMGSVTTRTGNGKDNALEYDVSNGKLQGIKWLRVINDSSANGDDAMVYIQNQNSGDWAQKINIGSANYGLYIQGTGSSLLQVGTNNRFHVDESGSKFNTNLTINGTLYFANGTTYYISNFASGYLSDLNVNRMRLADNWVGFYQNANAGGNRYGYIQADASCMYFRKENGNSGFNFNGHVLPNTTNTYDLGSSSNKWKNIYVTTLNGNLAKKLTIQANGTQKGQFNNSADVTVNLGNVAQDFTGANSGNAANINADTFAGMTRQQWLNTVYPIGSIYMSVNSTSPEVLFGGTWEALGGRFLIGANEDYTANSTGGSTEHTHDIAHTHTVEHSHTMAHTHTLSHTHTMAHTHTTGNHTLTIAETPSHNHNRGNMNITGSWQGLNIWQGNVNGGSSGAISWTPTSNGEYFSPTAWNASVAARRPGGVTLNAASNWTGTTNSVGGGGAHNHGNTGGSSAANTGGASATTTSGVSTPNTGESTPTTSAASNETSGSASTLPPYLVVYMWKRTA